MFKSLSGDNSAPLNVSDAEIERRLNYAIMSEDNGTVVDLRNQESDGKTERFGPFSKRLKNTCPALWEWCVRSVVMVSSCTWQKL